MCTHVSATVSLSCVPPPFPTSTTTSTGSGTSFRWEALRGKACRHAECITANSWCRSSASNINSCHERRRHYKRTLARSRTRPSACFPLHHHLQNRQWNARKTWIARGGGGRRRGDEEKELLAHSNNWRVCGLHRDGKVSRLPLLIITKRRMQKISWSDNQCTPDVFPFIAENPLRNGHGDTIELSRTHWQRAYF